jgi:hypothetical protein
MEPCERCGRETSLYPDPESGMELAIGNECLYCAITDKEAPESAVTESEASTTSLLGIKQNDYNKNSKH